MKERALYLLIRLLIMPFRYLPYSWIHTIGRFLGTLAYPFMRTYRKRTLSNLALASTLHLSERELIRIAKESFQNLAINALEYARFDRETDFSRIIQCENPEVADALHQKGRGIVFFCGHQSNWEALFLDGTSRMRGHAIGKSIKNKQLYRWIVSIREKKGGKIFSQRNALKEGLRALREGHFLGIVGDQGVPESNHLFPFLGRIAHTSTAPALLAAKTHSPLIVATTRRIKGGYRIRYSDPLWPDLTQPLEQEVTRLMNRALELLEESIRLSPGEWLWQHNRWKQQTPRVVYKQFRHDCICIALPQEESVLHSIFPHLQTLKKIYPVEFLSLLLPMTCKTMTLIPADERLYYTNKEELFRRDYRFKLLFNFTALPLASHYEQFSVFETITMGRLEQLATPHLSPASSYTLSDLLLRALCRPGTIW
jgi:KDO2-lipid IV(A) lauroyltransferase